MVLCKAIALAMVCVANGATCQADDSCEAGDETSLLQSRAIQASSASDTAGKEAWLKAKKARELKRGNQPAPKAMAPPQEPAPSQQPALASIEERVTSGTNLQTHRQRLREHFVRTRKETEAVADRLVDLMEKGVLGMWDPEDPQAIMDTYIVTLRGDCETDGSPSAHAMKMEEEVQETDGETLLRVFHDAVEGFTVKVPRGEGLLRIGEDTCVQSVEQDYKLRLEPMETEPGASSQTGDVPWGLDHIDGTMDGTYTYENTGAGTYVYVVDTGIQISHDEFQDGSRSRAVAGADYVNPDDGFNSGDMLGNTCGGSTVGSCTSPGEAGCTCGVIPQAPDGTSPCSGHGTHCAGTVAGRTVGVAKGATVVAVRVLNCRGSGSSSAVLGGMDYAVRMKDSQHPVAPTVISMSLGGPRPGPSYSDPSRDIKYAAVQAAKALGVTVVVAAGNEDVDADTRSPAHIDDAITVCAATVNDQRASFSCFGPGVDLCAPGVQVNSATTGANNAYATYSGTSMATPHVAGVLALMLENNGGWSVNQQAVELTTDCVEDDALDLLEDSCSTFRPQCDPDVVTSTPNKVQNLFGKGSQCAAAVGDDQEPPATTTTTTTTLPPGWQFSGNCEVSGGCVQSLGYPSYYGNNHECTIFWNAAGRPTLSSVDMQTEARYDILTVNGQEYSGTGGPPVGTVVEGEVRWFADYSVVNEGWRLCTEGGPAPPPASIGDLPWRVTDGACITSGRCIQSPNYPGTYGPNQKCTIQVSPVNTLPVGVTHFETERNYDFLIISGQRYSGSSTWGNPPPDGLTPTTDIEWESDHSIQDSGWEICLSGDDH